MQSALHCEGHRLAGEVRCERGSVSVGVARDPAAPFLRSVFGLPNRRSNSRAEKAAQAKSLHDAIVEFLPDGQRPHRCRCQLSRLPGFAR